jgi:predicted small metal-binding protein
MSKVLKCGDLVSGCPYEARGTEEEILEQAGRHAAEAHGLQVDDRLVEAVKAHLKTE